MINIIFLSHFPELIVKGGERPMKTSKHYKIPLLAVGLMILFSFGLGAVSAAGTGDNSTIYVSTAGNDIWDGQAAIYNSTTGSGPKVTIKNATQTVATGGTIHIATGTYHESNIYINKNMTIIGESQSGTIINGGNYFSIFSVNGFDSPVNLTISDLTLTNGTAIYAYLPDEGGMVCQFGGAIDNNGGTLTVNNVTFFNNTGAYDAGAIENNGGTLTLNNCTLNNNNLPMGNGGAIKNNGGTLTVNNSTFNNNAATENDGGNGGNGGAISNENGILFINNSTFTNNAVNASNQKYGGAIYSYYGTLSIVNSTFTNNTAFYGGAIFIDGGSLIVDKSTFTNNTADNYGEGGAIFNNYNDGGIVTVTNSSFDGNSGATGGAISNEYQDGNGALTVINSTFTNNRARNYGGAIYNNANNVVSMVTNCTFIKNTSSDYAGGAIANVGTLVVSNSIFMNNTAAQVAGAIYSGGSTNTNLTITGSTFTGNSAKYNGGAIDSEQILTAHYNRISNNTAKNGNQLYVFSASNSDISLNWWGTNTPTVGYVNGVDVYGTTLPSWLVLNISTNASTLNKGETAGVTIRLQEDSNGNVHDPSEGHIPDGVPVVLTSANGTLSTTSITLVNGLASSVFTAVSAGVGNVTATVDNQTVYVLLNVNKALTNITVDNTTGANKSPVNLVAKLTDDKGNPLSGQTVLFTVDGALVGTATTNGNGIATLSYTPTSSGNFTYMASYDATADYASSNSTGNLTVNPSAYLYLNVISSKTNLNVGETSVIKYKLGNSGSDTANNVTLSFQIPDGLEFVTASVDSGNWTYNTTTRTLTWTLDSVPVGDPYLNITVVPLSKGSYTIIPTITSGTANANNNALNSLTVNADAQSGSSTLNTTRKAVNAATTIKTTTKTVPMQHTGVPLAGLVLAVLAIFGGMLPRRK